MPTRQPTRQPTRIKPRRTAGDLFAGLGALIVLVALVGGVPYALLRLAGPPLPPELLDLDLLNSEVGTSTIVAILVLLVWLAWLQLVVCVLVELYAGLRRVGMPARVPSPEAPRRWPTGWSRRSCCCSRCRRRPCRS
nr:hypothetical protein GCM10020093_091480 [Planobispora longispora]